MSNPFESYRPESDQIDRQADRFDAAGVEARIKDAAPVSEKAGRVTNVELDRINDTDFNSAADFRNPEQHAELRREAEMLKQMQPALEQGANADTFDSWDKANQIGHYSPGEYVRGYIDVYHS